MCIRDRPRCVRDARALTLRLASRAAPLAAPVREPELLLTCSRLHVAPGPSLSLLARSFRRFLSCLDSAPLSVRIRTSTLHSLEVALETPLPARSFFSSSVVRPRAEGAARRGASAASEAGHRLCSSAIAFAPHEAR